MPSSLRQRRQRRSRQQKRGARRSARRGFPTDEEMDWQGGRRRSARRDLMGEPSETVAVMETGELVPVEEVQPGEVVSELVEMPANQVETLNGGRSRRLRRGGRRASRAAQRGGRAVSLKTAVRLLRNYYAKRYA
jgi:hypothetical protein